MSYAGEGALQWAARWGQVPPDTITDRNGRQISIESVAAAWAAADIVIDALFMGNKVAEQLRQLQALPDAPPEIVEWVTLNHRDCELSFAQGLLAVAWMYDLHGLAPDALSSRMIKYGLDSGLSRIELVHYSTPNDKVVNVFTFATTDDMRAFANAYLDSMYRESQEAKKSMAGIQLAALPIVTVGIIAGAIIITILGTFAIGVWAYAMHHKALMQQERWKAGQDWLADYVKTGNPRALEAALKTFKDAQELTDPDDPMAKLKPILYGGLALGAVVAAAKVYEASTSRRTA